MLKEKNWSKELERSIYEGWKRKKAYRFNERKPVYSIDTPPPYVNTPVHIGHATTYVLMDMFARFRRMQGFNVLFPLGLDRNGLPIEMAAEKRFNVSLKDVSREEFIKFCGQILEESSAESIDSFLRLGISFNSWKVGKKLGDMYFTDSKDYRTLTQATFIDMWNKGLVYEDKRINNYCPGCGTTLADAEVDYKDIETTFNDVIFTVKESGEKLIISTTRPELIATCAMVIYNPSDDRHQRLEGKTAITPVYGKEVPITAHPLADPEKGSGLVMMCSMGDQNDIRFFRDMKLKPVIAIDENGKMNSSAGFLEGLTVKEARQKIIDELRAKQLLVDQRKVMHRTPICERSKHPIEFIEQQELYLKQLKFRRQMKKLAKRTKFYANESRQLLLDWIDSLTIDWPLSRRRYYATEIPLWYCNSCGEAVVPQAGRYYRPWKEQPPVKRCKKCKSTSFRGEERVFDTWFDSSISPLYIMKYPEKFFQKHKFCTLRPQGKEIVRNWLYYTFLRCYLILDRGIFRDVWLHYHVVDEKGKKMSKSLGNVIDPHEILEKYGAEPFRLWCAVEGNLDKQDFRCSFERIEGTGKTLAKLWNVARFVSMLPSPRTKRTVMEMDRWIIKEMAKLIRYSRRRYNKYDFHNPTIKLRHFLWETFASHYLELVKNRAYNQDRKFSKEQQESALYALNYCLGNMLKLLAPVMPMFTQKIYKDLYKKDIHDEEFPKPKQISARISTQDIEDLNSFIWKSKKDRGLSLKAEIKELTLLRKYSVIAKDIVACHNASKLRYGRAIELIL